MRVLFISEAKSPDYQSDILFHGLRSLLGDDVIDCQRLDYMYKKTFENNQMAKAALYGRGFTLYGLLDEDINVDRDDIRRKIARKHFDIVVYGSVHRCRDYLDDVLQAYNQSEIIFVDGEDEADVLFYPLIGRGMYYKRELMPALYGMLKPISFGIPEEKICLESVKTKNIAFIDPRDKSTYIYQTEADYYSDYQESLFAYTMKKAGWDCLRHYEIIANHCMPIFIELDKCPLGTMHYFPRLEIMEINHILEKKGVEYFNTTNGLDQWLKIASSTVEYLKRHLTTKALAKRIIAEWRKEHANNFNIT